jgi:hypothetical protein
VATRDRDVPRYAYPLAVIGGFVGASFIMAASYFWAGDLLGYLAAEWPDRYYGNVGGAATISVLGHATLGALFGLLWPEKTWRWGVWLCSLASVLAALTAPDARAFLAWEALTLLPAGLGAYAAGRLHLKFTAVEESR